MNNEEENLEGIKGWLILVAIGIILSPIRMGMQIYPLTKSFSSEAWSLLTTPGSPIYNPFWKPIIIGEVVIDLFIFLSSIYIIYLFFTKKSAFPKWYIGIALFSLVVLIADSYAIKLVMPNKEVFDHDTMKELSRALFTVAIWVPYMLVSKRVKATFVN